MSRKPVRVAGKVDIVLPRAFVPIVVLALFLLPAVALAADPPPSTPVGNRDRVRGVLAEAGSEVGLALELLAGSEITLKARATGGSFIEPELLLFDPEGEPVDLAGCLRHTAGSTKARLRGFHAPVTGAYLLVVRTLTDRIGQFDLRIRLRHPVKIRDVGEIVASDGVALLAFPAFENSALHVRVKGRNGFLPKLETLLVPGGDIHALTGVEARGRVVRSREYETPTHGDYRLRIESRDGGIGAWKGRIRLAHPADEPRELTVQGQPEGTWTGDDTQPPQPPPPPPPPPVIEWRRLSSGYGRGITSKLETAARTQAAFDGLWTQHQLVGPSPAVDFSKEMVVGIFLGHRPQREVIVVSVEAAGTGIEVVYEDRLDPRQYFIAPPPYPFAFIAVTRVAGTVTIRSSVK